MKHFPSKGIKMLKVIFLGLFIDLLAFTLILPLLPGLLDHYKVLALCIPTTHSKCLQIFTQACLSRLKLFWAKGKHKKPGLIGQRHDESGWYAAAESRVRQFGQIVGAPDQFIPVLFGGLIGSMFSFLQFLGMLINACHQGGKGGGPDPLQILNPWKQMCF